MSSVQKLLTLVRDQAGEIAFDKAQQLLGGGTAKVGLRIPAEMITDDKQAQQLIREFGLEKPEKMLQFMVESFYGALESIQDNVHWIQQMQVAEFTAYVKSAKQMYNYGIENPEDKRERFKTAQNELFKAVEVLKAYVTNCIKAIRDTDDLPRWKFFINAKQHMKTINANMTAIRLALDAIEQAVSMQTAIAKELGAKIETSVLRPYEEFYDNTLLAGDTPRLLDAYEFEEKKPEQYFLRLAEKRGRIRTLDLVYEEYADELEGYDTIIF